MNIIKGCIKELTKEQEQKTYEKIPGLILMGDWRPFNYIVMLFDYKDIIKRYLDDKGCIYKLTNVRLFLEEDNRYSVDLLKIPKFNQDNLERIVYIVENVIGQINLAGGKNYTTFFNEIDELEY